MDWQREAEDKLRKYAARKNSLTNIAEELRALQARATGIRSATLDGTPVRCGGNGRENYLLSNLVRREELENNLQEAEIWVEGVDRALAVLTDEERLVLDRFYIHPGRGNVERLCEELCVEKSSVYRRRDRAIRNFTFAYYGWRDN